jgi:hypothetical protein
MVRKPPGAIDRPLGPQQRASRITHTDWPELT